MNDLTELHQNEIENLKQAMADMEEKVQYQSDERLRDVNEVLENCQTRVRIIIFLIYYLLCLSMLIIHLFFPIDIKNGTFITTTICNGGRH